LRPAEAASLALAAVIFLLAVRLTCLDYRIRKGPRRLPAFDAGSVVEPLDYKFEAFVPGCNGRITEPADDQIVKFLTDVKALVTRLHEKAEKAEEEASVDGRDPAGLVDAIEELDPSVVGEFHQELAGIFAALCSGTPSREAILGLPMRIRVMFYGWLRQEVMNPEAAPGAGNAQVTTLRSAAAG
jgi:hypothetical protein